MRALRAAAFGLAEGVRLYRDALYRDAVRRMPGDSGGVRRQARPLGAELMGVVESSEG
jgi:hypothetical protein